MNQKERAAFAGQRAKQGQTNPRGIAILLLIFMLALFASACGNSTDKSTNVTGTPGNNKPEQTNSPQPTTKADEPQMQTVKHEYGETKVPLHPKRVAVVGLEDIMLSLEAPLVYAYGFDGYYLEEQLREAKITLSGSADIKPNLEAILAAQPDLIVVQKYFVDQGGYDELSKVAPTLAYAPDDWKSTIVSIGKALGIEEQAQEVIENYHDKLKEAKETIVQAVGSDKTVAFIRPSDKDLQVFFPSFNFVYRDLGLKPDASIAEFQKVAPDDWGIDTSLEKLPSITADYVFAIYGGSISTSEEWAMETAASTEVEKLQVWKAMPAVKQNHVFKVSSRHWMSSGPIAEGREIDDVVAAVTGKKQLP
ncbi:ABC transporter substrate-binding protein [Paenibacillus eucommiae]|uniref:Iron complex transport system substrate-binding protein n=1 Tax=Paenibacillus eucommiae TaxID=1355755 RepID=A0ABS4J4V9_9BACL|nr:ABC transporter substrate-binding protein [Paenibacillus eucommiae]MBP1994868.1 iron complex transport system substrate-binding protein [Paenibacillus eucommiae]